MSNQHPLTPEIMALIERKTGLLMREPHRAMDAHFAIARTLAESGLSDHEMLYSQLQHHDSQHPLWQKLVQLLTIGETYFFRNQALFTALRNEILPRIIERKRERRHRWLRIWSAGCATGEEIYSLAILLRELLPDYKSWSLYLIGTDINEEYLEQARQGLYRENSFRGETPEHLKRDWFTRYGHASKLDASIRNMVIFKNLNLVTDEYPTLNPTLRSMDLIFCQNVTIYFDRPTTENIQNHLIGTLAEDGWLILGHSEPLFAKSPYLEVRNFTNAVVFQRQPDLIPGISKITFETKGESHSHVSNEAEKKVPLRLRPSLKELLDISKSEESKVSEICRQAQHAADNKLWDDARALLDSLLQMRPLHEYGHYLRALIYIEQGHPDEALGALGHSLYCNPNFILARYLLGELWHQLGDVARAKKEWRFAQNLLSHMAPEDLIPHSDDLSVEMLNGLLTMQLSSGGLKS